MVEKFNGNSGKNARININYSGKKPKVRFSYPDKKKQSGQVGFNMFLYIFIGWFVFSGLILIGVSISQNYMMPNEEVNKTDMYNYSQCIGYYDDYKLETCEERENKNSVIWFFYSFKEAYKEDYSGLITLLIWIIPPFLIYFPFKKRWDSLFPKVQGLTAKKKYRTFKEIDIIERDGDIYCEVPIFANVLLNFDATKDFSKYLKEFEIKEHNFKYNYKPLRIKKGKKPKIQNEWLWYARFYFSDKPKTGKLEVIFK